MVKTGGVAPMTAMAAKTVAMDYAMKNPKTTGGSMFVLILLMFCITCGPISSICSSISSYLMKDSTYLDTFYSFIGMDEDGNSGFFSSLPSFPSFR